MADPFTLDALAEVLAPVVSRHASVRDDAGVWLATSEPVHDAQGVPFWVRADLHPGDARDAARDLVDLLEARGLTVRREVFAGGNDLGTRLLRLAVELFAAPGDADRTTAVASALCALAAEAQTRDEAVVPAHLRVPFSGLPENLVRLCDRRRA